MAKSLTQSTLSFCGIGGIGMSALAQVLVRRGARVRGSDRGFDTGQNQDRRAALEQLGIEIFPQDGTGVDRSVDVLVVSSAVEPTVPDVKTALALGLPVRRRAEILADLFNRTRGIAVAGTSGKTTVTGMIGHILHATGHSPTVVNGGVMRNAPAKAGLGNVIDGNDRVWVVESDESDGSIELYQPAVGVVANISLDHKPLSELRTLFGDFVERCTEAVVIGGDCAEARQLARAQPRAVTFGIDGDNNCTATDLLPTDSGTRFRCGGVAFEDLGAVDVDPEVVVIGFNVGDLVPETEGCGRIPAETDRAAHVGGHAALVQRVG